VRFSRQEIRAKGKKYNAGCRLKAMKKKPKKSLKSLSIKY